MAQNCGCTPSCPCITLCKPTTLPKPCPDVSQNCCLKACNGLIEACDSVGPCGKVLETDLNILEHHLEGIQGNPIFSLISFDDSIFATASLTKAGVLTVVTMGPEAVNKYGEVCFKIQGEPKEECGCPILSSQGKITIGVKDLCLLNTCEDCDICDPCTGDCIPKDANLAVKSNTNNSNITVNG